MATRPYSRLTAEQKRKIAFSLTCRLLETRGARIDLSLLYAIADRVVGREVRLSERTVNVLRKAGRARYALERQAFARGVAEMCG